MLFRAASVVQEQTSLHLLLAVNLAVLGGENLKS